MPITPQELLDAAVGVGLIDADTVESLRVRSRQRRESLLETATLQGRFPLAAMYRALADRRGWDYIDMAAELPEPELVRRVSETIIRRRLVLPVRQQDNTVLVATADPDDRGTLESIQRSLGANVQSALCDPESLQLAIDRVLTLIGGRAATGGGEAIDAVSLLDRIMREAFLRRASDIHIESEATGTRVRLRIDGRLRIFMTGLDPELGNSLLSRVKVLANLDIAEQRAPQDGRFSYSPPGRDDVEIDLRVATVPTRWGERATLRLLGMNAGDLTLESLGMSPKQLVKFREVIRRPHGIILLTGPTGSGKSTTLYSALSEINQTHLNIITVEDPIEYLIPGVNQVHVGGTDKVSFASALRSLLRHDPDVMMVGEIRDPETADVAMKAALTGHLLFSTLHTNTACGAITRLVDIGCEPFLIGASLVASIAQRLVRRLCPRCKRPRLATERELALLGLTDSTVEVYEPTGCAACLGTGFTGRIGLFETLWIDQELARLISQGATQSQIEQSAPRTLTTLRADGIEKILQGITTVDEVMTATVVD